ncbi:MAG: tetratricopeptide repeat protein [Planctomycetota bacterium]|nr:tetratricopeptide repeat protein [Planctomycetota bacterium]
MRGFLSLCVAIALLVGAIAAAPDISAEARSLFDGADLAREEGRLAEATKGYAEALDKSGMYWEAHRAYLDTLRARSNYTGAAELYAKLRKRHPDEFELKIYQAAAQEPEAAKKALLGLAGADNVRYLIELGRAYLLSGDSKGAEKQLKAAVKIQEDSLAARLLLGDTYLARRKYSTARKEYEAVLELDSTHVPAMIRTALCWHRGKKSEKGIKILEDLVSDENLPRLASGHWMLVIIHAEKADYAKALARIGRVAAIDKGKEATLIAKGQILLAMHQPVEAAKVFAKAAEAKDSTWLSHFCLGWAHEVSADSPEIDEAKQVERLTAAAEAYSKATRLSPGVRPRDSIGFVQLRLGEHRIATTQFKRALDIDPKFTTALNNLGLADDIAENRSQAMERYEKVLAKLDRRNVRAIVMLGLDYWLVGALPKAIKKFKEALKINPEDDLAWTFLGDVHYEKKKLRDAIRAYEKAVKINDKNFIAWFHMGIAYDDQKKDEESDAAYRKALDAKPDPPPELFLRLGYINDDLRKYEDAVKFYKEYLEEVPDEDIQARVEELEEQLAGN